MKAYSVVGVSGSGTTKTILGVIGSTAIRARCFEWKAGCNDAPADQSWQPSLGRFTATGTSTSYTPQPLDPADIAAVCTAGITHTVEPTYPATPTTYIDQISINQRASWKWQATPGCEIVAAAATSNGLGLVGNAATASLHMSGSLFWYE